MEGQFPGSVRVQRMRGMLLEAEGKFTQALEFYEEAMGGQSGKTGQAGNAVLWKRKVAVYKAMGDTGKAIAELNSFLQV